MFDPRGNDVFDRQGNLRTSVTFRFVGEISTIAVRQWQNVKLEQDREGKNNYSLILTDKYGFTCSVFKKGWSLERLQAYQAKIPYGTTLIIEGDVALRKGQTFFNADSVCFPNGETVGSLVLMGLRDKGVNEEKEGEYEEETVNAPAE